MQSTSVLIRHPDVVVATGLQTILAGRREFSIQHSWQPPHSADVLITDLDGGVAAARLRARGEFGPAILVLSDRDTEWNVRNALECGVHGYLLQSAGLDEIIDAVRHMGRRQRYMSAALEPVVAQSLTRDVLTSRESDVLQLIAKGQCNKVIARNLGIGLGTVKSHIKGVMGKLDAQGRTHAVVIAAQRGLISPTLGPGH
jgi:DNA-binding NarL/FixJ family response regulator